MQDLISASFNFATQLQSTLQPHYELFTQVYPPLHLPQLNPLLTLFTHYSKILRGEGEFHKLATKGEPMQVSADIQALGLILEALVAIPIFVGLSLLLMKIVELISSRLARFIRYLAFPGVVLHELCHELLCRITRVPVLEHRLRFLNNKSGVEGILIDTRHIRTFTTGFLVAFAPVIILALALYMSLLFWSMLPMHELLKYYFIFCFFIGLAPSKTDWLMVSSVVKTDPRQAFFELSLLSLPVITTFCYLLLRPIWNLPFSIFSFCLAFFTGVLVSLLTWRYYKSHRNSQKYTKIIPASLEPYNNKLILTHGTIPGFKPTWPEEQLNLIIKSGAND
ncbi:MAG: metalloprotease family protein [Candidatus Hermodarchaeota archaeon]|nr:metalloprotease family protein [Candidatus Hermodarchaeota archaeon]